MNKDLHVSLRSDCFMCSNITEPSIIYISKQTCHHCCVLQKSGIFLKAPPSSGVQFRAFVHLLYMLTLDSAQTCPLCNIELMCVYMIHDK